jgi:hypothetical protein
MQEVAQREERQTEGGLVEKLELDPWVAVWDVALILYHSQSF